MRPRTFAAAALACTAVAVSAAGCGGHSRRTHPGTGRLSIYTSLPFAGPYAADAQAVFDGEQLALAQAGSRVNGSKVILRRLNDATAAGPTAALVAQSARAAAGDGTTIAYIGELTPGSSSASIPTLSGAGILQVSPGDSATDLAGKTFARVVPQDADEADAQLAALKKLGVKTLYLLEDRTTHGRDLAATVLQDAVSYGLGIANPLGRYGANTRALVRAIKKSRASAVLYAGSPAPAVPTIWNAISAADPTLKKMASASIIDDPSWAQTTAAARENTYLSAPGLLLHSLPRAGTQFVSDFAAAYGNRVPWASGIFGYVAMSGVLEALHSLGPRPQNARSRVALAFLRLRDLPSALGTYSIVGGQTSFRAYVFSTYHRGVAAPAYDSSLS
ncbi:MAG TPA: ABC transporter substrate-binding protein [Solirubrobacteraceae bacterium]|nr:ABC transporter substrate-binding protein [Solirubrobacteraceae bacterium]